MERSAKQTLVIIYCMPSECAIRQSAQHCPPALQKLTLQYTQVMADEHSPEYIFALQISQDSFDNTTLSVHTPHICLNFRAS